MEIVHPTNNINNNQQWAAKRKKKDIRNERKDSKKEIWWIPYNFICPFHHELIIIEGQVIWFFSSIAHWEIAVCAFFNV